jgi:hypothetical protein
VEAIENDVDGLLFKIIDLRAYAKAYQIFRQGEKESDITKRPTGPHIDLVEGFEVELQKERLAQKRKKP